MSTKQLLRLPRWNCANPKNLGSGARNDRIFHPVGARLKNWKQSTRGLGVVSTVERVERGKGQ
jgi:hypothetical protein